VFVFGIFISRKKIFASTEIVERIVPVGHHYFGGMEMSKKSGKKFKIRWSLIFNVIILGLTAFLILYFVFSEGGFVDLINSGLKINVVWIFIAIFVHLTNIALDMTVIYLFMKENCPEMTLYKAFICSMTGQFFCAVTPSATGGQPMQILSMSRMGIRPAKTTAALIQKFLVWQFTLATVCIIAVVARFGFFAQFLDPPMWVASIIGFLAQIALIVVLLLASFCKPLTTRVVNAVIRFFGRIHIIKNPEEKITSIDETLTSFHDSNKNLNKNKPLLIKVYAITAVQMVSFFLVPYCIARSFNIDCNVFDMLCAQAYVNMVSCLVPLPGGSGAAEYCFGIFFGSYFTPITIKSAILLWRTITYYGTIIITAPFAMLKSKKTEESLEEELS